MHTALWWKEQDWSSLWSGSRNLLVKKFTNDFVIVHVLFTKKLWNLGKLHELWWNLCKQWSLLCPIDHHSNARLIPYIVTFCTRRLMIFLRIEINNADPLWKIYSMNLKRKMKDSYLWIPIDAIYAIVRMMIWLIASTCAWVDISHHCTLARWNRSECFLQLFFLLAIFSSSILEPNLLENRIIYMISVVNWTIRIY